VLAALHGFVPMQMLPPPPMPAAMGGPKNKKSRWKFNEDQVLQAQIQHLPRTADGEPPWDKIAECIPGRTAKQCRERCVRAQAHWAGGGGDGRNFELHARFPPSTHNLLVPGAFARAGGAACWTRP